MRTELRALKYSINVCIGREREREREMQQTVDQRGTEYVTRVGMLNVLERSGRSCVCVCVCAGSQVSNRSGSTFRYIAIKLINVYSIRLPRIGYKVSVWNLGEKL